MAAPAAKPQAARPASQGPQDGVVFDLDASCFESDEFRMYSMKIRRCPRARPHDWTQCPFAHPGEKAKRRDPRRFRYSGTACPEFRRNGCCRRGDVCPFAHGVFECWLHPSRYRTQPCTDGPSCKRRVCFFAHTEAELRKPEEDPVWLQQQLQAELAAEQQAQQQLAALKVFSNLLSVNQPSGGSNEMIKGLSALLNLCGSQPSSGSPDDKLKSAVAQALGNGGGSGNTGLVVQLLSLLQRQQPSSQSTGGNGLANGLACLLAGGANQTSAPGSDSSMQVVQQLVQMLQPQQQQQQDPIQARLTQLLAQQQHQQQSGQQQVLELLLTLLNQDQSAHQQQQQPSQTDVLGALLGSLGSATPASAPAPAPAEGAAGTGELLSLISAVLNNSVGSGTAADLSQGPLPSYNSAPVGTGRSSSELGSASSSSAGSTSSMGGSASSNVTSGSSAASGGADPSNGQQQLPAGFERLEPSLMAALLQQGVMGPAAASAAAQQQQALGNQNPLLSVNSTLTSIQSLQSVLSQVPSLSVGQIPSLAAMSSLPHPQAGVQQHHHRNSCDGSLAAVGQPVREPVRQHSGSGSAPGKQLQSHRASSSGELAAQDAQDSLASLHLQSLATAAAVALASPPNSSSPRSAASDGARGASSPHSSFLQGVSAISPANSIGSHSSGSHAAMLAPTPSAPAAVSLPSAGANSVASLSALQSLLSTVRSVSQPGQQQQSRLAPMAALGGGNNAAIYDNLEVLLETLAMLNGSVAGGQAAPMGLGAAQDGSAGAKQQAQEEQRRAAAAFNSRNSSDLDRILAELPRSLSGISVDAHAIHSG